MNVNVFQRRNLPTVADRVAPSDLETEALVRELQALRRGEGLSLRKLSTAPTLLQLSAAPERDAAPEDGRALFDADQAVRGELAGLGDGLGARALRAALALDHDDPMTLTHRRHDFAEATGKHPDTVESYENRAIRELALRIIARSPGGLAPRPEAASARPTGREDLDTPDRVSLVCGYPELLDRLLDVARGAREYLVTTGSRSRDPDYLASIEERLQGGDVIHYRVLCGPPHWSVLKTHLRRLHEMRRAAAPGGDPRILLGVVSDFRREPERFICASERKAVLILPSLNGLEHFDTGLALDGEQYGKAYVRLVQELYAASRPIETDRDIDALPVVRE